MCNVSICESMNILRRTDETLKTLCKATSLRWTPTKAVSLDIASTDKLLTVSSLYHTTWYQNWRATSSLLILLFASSHAHGRHQPVDVITFIRSSSSSSSSRLREHLADCRGDRSDGEEDDDWCTATRRIGLRLRHVFTHLPDVPRCGQVMY